jgi:hypothetical protein
VEPTQPTKKTGKRKARDEEADDAEPPKKRGRPAAKTPANNVEAEVSPSLATRQPEKRGRGKGKATSEPPTRRGLRSATTAPPPAAAVETSADEPSSNIVDNNQNVDDEANGATTDSEPIQADGEVEEITAEEAVKAPAKSSNRKGKKPAGQKPTGILKKTNTTTRQAKADAGKQKKSGKGRVPDSEVTQFEDHGFDRFGAVNIKAWTDPVDQAIEQHRRQKQGPSQAATAEEDQVVEAPEIEAAQEKDNNAGVQPAEPEAPAPPRPARVPDSLPAAEIKKNLVEATSEEFILDAMRQHGIPKPSHIEAGNYDWVPDRVAMQAGRQEIDYLTERFNQMQEQGYRRIREEREEVNKTVDALKMADEVNRRLRAELVTATNDLIKERLEHEETKRLLEQIRKDKE